MIAPGGPSTDVIRIPQGRLVDYAAAVLEGARVPSDRARLIGAYLVEANMRGVHSHGVDLLPYYFRGFVQGALDPEADPTVMRESASFAIVDARGGLGHPAAHAAMELAVTKALDAGIALAVVRNSNHFGMAGHWPMIAVRHGLVGFATTNGPPVMAPWGGRTAAICNNPFSWGIPAGDEFPLLLDMACTTEARGKVRLALQRGQRLPEGWALDCEGAPTTDPAAALDGVMLPVGGPKGSGIAIVNEVLSSLLPGANALSQISSATMSNVGLHVTWGCGHVFMAIDPSWFLGLDAFRSGVDGLIRELRAVPPMGGHDRVYMPGERGFLRFQEAERLGVPVMPDSAAKLVPFADECGIAFPSAWRVPTSNATQVTP